VSLGCPDGRSLGGAEPTRSPAAGQHARNEKDGGHDAERGDISYLYAAGKKTVTSASVPE
jgi:hypothetical protein